VLQIQKDRERKKTKKIDRGVEKRERLIDEECVRRKDRERMAVKGRKIM